MQKAFTNHNSYTTSSQKIIPNQLKVILMYITILLDANSGITYLHIDEQELWHTSSGRNHGHKCDVSNH